MAKVEFVISKKGEIKMEVSGATGISCDDLTKVFADGLGTTTDVQRKPEYYVELEGMEVHAHEGEE